ncbi:hypothetical protein [Salipiger bermudensis]|uniref:hypothetical protein n=1 Tax=Salipiger bermudensis TaxID=344736 RepID=UPI001CD7C117|nr:hypothetical protein [Salipiger bermudensis]MCA0961743.1 hypothetical protein [Salipiger bermudensis]
MSDPVTNVEIEDVLSSIRRLVADDAREKSAPQSGQGKLDRLVLTPALRVPEDRTAPSPAADKPSTVRHASEDLALAERGPASSPAADARETAAVPFRLHRAPTDESSPEKQPGAPRADAEPLAPAASARRLTLGLPASDEEFEEIYDDGGDEPSFDTSTLLGKLVEEELARALASETEARPKFARSRPARTQEAATGPQGRGADDEGRGAADDGIPTAEAPLPEPELPEMSAHLHDTVGENARDGEASLAQKIAALEAMIARHKAEEAEAQEDASTATVGQMSDDAAHSVDTVRAAFVHRPQKPLEWQDHTPNEVGAASAACSDALVLEGPIWRGADRHDVPAASRHLPDLAVPEHGDALPAPVDLFDEEMLRDLVTETIRQELQGALGERITRNVRKMVRREIHRMVTSEYFD